MGRPAKAGDPVIVNVKLSLWPGEDDDLIDFFNNATTTYATAVKVALRSGGGLQALIDPDQIADDEMDDVLSNMVF